MVLSSGQNGGNRDVIDKGPGEEVVPVPQVDWEADWDRKTSACLFRLQTTKSKRILNKNLPFQSTSRRDDDGCLEGLTSHSPFFHLLAQ